MEIEDDGADEKGLYDYALTHDDFGVSSNLMGMHPEPFFSMLGRIVALSATLEYKVLTFYQSLAGRDQHAFTELSISRIIAGARKQLPRLAVVAERQMASDYLDEAEAITRRRNDYVHNLWPAQPGGRTFGWRRPQKKGATGTIIVEGTLEDMRGDLNRLVAFLEVGYQQRVYGSVSSGRHLDNEPNVA